MSIARVVSVNLSSGGIPKLPRPRVRVLADRLEGDGRGHAKHDRIERAVSILDAELFGAPEYEPFALEPGKLGENLTVEGLNAQELLPGTRLRFEGGVVLEVSEPRVPCYVLDAIDPRVKEVAWGRCGVLASVVTTGELAPGQSIEVLPMQEPEAPAWEHVGAILAGGQGSRMGQPKEGVRLPDGRALIEPGLAALRSICRKVVVVGACRGFRSSLPREVEVVEDLLPDRGPLGGLDALLHSGLSEMYLVAPCDQPLLSAYLLRLLTRRGGSKARFLRDDLGRKWEPFPGVFPAAWKDDVRRAIEEGRLGMRQFLKEQPPAAWITIPSRLTGQLANANDRETLARLMPSAPPR